MSSALNNNLDKSTQYTLITAALVLAIPEIPLGKSCEAIMDLRIASFTENDDADGFDRFFFFSLIFLFPKALLENFQVSVEASTRVLSRLPNLRYIASETWVGSTSINLFRALAFELRNIKTFHIEHNCIFHPFIGDFVKFQSELVDQYMTFGWVSPESKFVSLGSLFPFKIPKKKN